MEVFKIRVGEAHNIHGIVLDERAIGGVIIRVRIIEADVEDGFHGSQHCAVEAGAHGKQGALPQFFDGCTELLAGNFRRPCDHKAGWHGKSEFGHFA